VVYISVIVGELMVLFDRNILQFLYGNAEADVLAVMREYMLYSSFSLPFLALYTTISGIMRASGNTRLPMFGSLFANVAHLLVAYPMIYIFGLGIAGVGWGLIAFRLVPALFLGWQLWRGASGIYLPKLSPKLDMRVLRPVMRVALPTGIDTVIFACGRLIIQVFLAGMGTAVLAANAIIIAISFIFELPGNVFLIVIITVAGQNFGAKNFRRARRDMLRYTLIASLVTAVPCVLALPVREHLFLLFGASAQTIAAGMSTLILYLISQPFFWCAAFISHAALRATDSAKYTMWVSIACMLAGRIVLSWFLGVYLDWKLFGVWLSMIIDWGLRGAFFVPRMVGLCKRQERAAALEAAGS